MPSYQEYLASAEWRRKRDATMRRAGGTCEMCERRPATQVHHIRYPKKLGDEPLADLLAVCRQCHEKGHGMIEAPRDSLVLRFEDTEIRSLIEADDAPLFLWEDVERAAIGSDERALTAARRGRPALLEQMREGRHFERRQGRHYLTEAGIYRWAQIFPRPAVWSEDHRLWQFSDWTEDTCKALRTGQVAIVNQGKAAAAAHPELMQALELLARHSAQETKRLTHESQRNDAQDARIEELSAALPRRPPRGWITTREGCFELGLDPAMLVRGKLNLETEAGNVLSRSGAQHGPKRDTRLSGSARIISPNTYRREDVYNVLRRLAG